MLDISKKCLYFLKNVLPSSFPAPIFASSLIVVENTLQLILNFEKLFHENLPLDTLLLIYKK